MGHRKAFVAYNLCILHYLYYAVENFFWKISSLLLWRIVACRLFINRQEELIAFHQLAVAAVQHINKLLRVLIATIDNDNK